MLFLFFFLAFLELPFDCTSCLLVFWLNESNDLPAINSSVSTWKKNMNKFQDFFYCHEKKIVKTQIHTNSKKKKSISKQTIEGSSVNCVCCVDVISGSSPCKNWSIVYRVSSGKPEIQKVNKRLTRCKQSLSIL